MSDRRTGLPPAFLNAGTSSFSEFAAQVSPTVLPSSRTAAPGLGELAPHGTTIVAATFPGGVVVAGDRRATMGNMIAQRDIEKVFPADEFSIIGIAGAAGHRGRDGRPVPGGAGALREDRGRARCPWSARPTGLATMIRQNLALALQGLVVVPLFAGWDVATEEGRIFSYDATGGRYEEHAFFSVGLRLGLRPGLAEEAVPARSDRPPRRPWRWSRRCTTPPTTTPRPVGRI